MNVKFTSPYPAIGLSTEDEHGYVTLEVNCHNPSVEMEARMVRVYLYRDPGLTLQRLSEREVEWKLRASGAGYHHLDRMVVAPPSPELFDLLVGFHLRPNLPRLLTLLESEYGRVLRDLIRGFRRHAESWAEELDRYRRVEPDPPAWVATRGIEMGDARATEG